MSEQAGLRGKAWFQALTGKGQPQTGDPASVWSANEKIGPQTALFLCVVPNLESRFPCVRDGQVGLEEAYTLAARVRETMDADRKQPCSQKRPIVAIVDVKSQAYGRREETAGIFLAAAASADAYASARMAGHPVIALVVGQALSGGFLTDRKSTRLNSSHQIISYAVFCLKKKKNSPWRSLHCRDARRCA